MRGAGKDDAGVSPAGAIPHQGDMTFRPCLILALLPLAACVAPKTVAPPPRPIPLPAPPPAKPQTADWRDIPLTPGGWHYDAATTTARFGPEGAPALIVRCDPAARTVSLARSGTGAAPTSMSITTSAGDRALAAVPIAGSPPAIVSTLPARDGFLDRMAFSRGRFVIAVGGTPRLVIPAWPEFARVVEDCRG